ncbi:hypothetical protein [Lentzea sp. E54]|uniref:hypothetical protein n=1 Tax=Lentzea xerophila TaxID=3435883 RepID=UPI003DA519C0
MATRHTVTQTAPDGTTVDADLWGVTDADAEQYCRDMKADNPDYRYAWRREPALKLNTYGQVLAEQYRALGLGAEPNS